MEELTLTSIVTAVVTYLLGIVLSRFGVKLPAITPAQPPAPPAPLAPVVGPLGLPAPDGKGALAKAILALLAKRVILGEQLVGEEAEAFAAIERASMSFQLAPPPSPKEVK